MSFSGGLYLQRIFNVAHRAVEDVLDMIGECGKYRRQPGQSLDDALFAVGADVFEDIGDGRDGQDGDIQLNDTVFP